MARLAGPLPHRTRIADTIANLDIDAAWHLYDAQARFVASDSLFSLFLGGVGSGKSHALAGWVIRRALSNPGSVGALLGRTGIDLATVLEPALFDRLQECQDQSGVCLIKDHDKGNATLTLINGSQIMFKPFNRIAKVRGPTWTFAGMDEVEFSEASPEEIWSVITGRMRGKGPLPGLAFATSPNGLRGITKKFVDAQRHYREAVQSGDFAEVAKWARWSVVTATSFHNPYNPPHFFETLRSMSKRRYAQEVEGKVLRPQNVVLTLEARHLIPWDWRRHTELPRVYGVDWGTQDHHVATMTQITPAGRWIVADELVCDGIPRGQFLDRLCRWIDGHGENPPTLIGVDRACPSENQLLQGRYRQTRVGWMESTADQAITKGIELMRDMMDPIEGDPMLCFSDSLAQTYSGITAPIIPALRGYCYYLDSDGQPTTKTKKDNITDHAIDSLRYVCMASSDDPRLHGGQRLWQTRVIRPRDADVYGPGNSGATV